MKQFAKLLRKSRDDPVLFARTFLNFEPYPFQKDFLRNNSRRIVACCGRQVGKTTLGAIKAIHFALTHNSVLVLVISAGLRQSIYLFDKILELIDGCVPAKIMKTYASRTKVRFANGSEIIALPCGRQGFTIRGLSVDLAIVDEAAYVPRVVIESVISPMLITRPNAKKIYLSTPWMKDHPFYEASARPELGFIKYTWPTSMNPKVTKEDLEREKLAIGEYNFDREFNGVFQDDQFAFFPSDLVLDCAANYDLNPEPSPEQKYQGAFYIGIDFGIVEDHAAVAILQKIATNEIRLVYLKEFPLKTLYKVVIDSVQKLNNAYHFRGGGLDKTSVGVGLHEDISSFMHIEGVPLTAPKKEELMGKLKLAMENHQITIPRDKSLLAQITSQQCKRSESGGLHFDHPYGTHDDQLHALVLALPPALQGDLQKAIFRTAGAPRLT
ncbi:MAG: terminase large subunit domain-containing protein [Candidatus Bathyarchaeia archaeon]